MHLCARPLLPELRCVLGRETAMQKMFWTDDGWLRLEGGGNLAGTEFTPAALPEQKFPVRPARDHFDVETLPIDYYAPRQSPAQFCDLTQRPGHLRIRGEESLCSARRSALIARKLDALGGHAGLRMKNDAPFVTDNGNYILDVSGLQIADPAGLEAEINNYPGVVTVGLFARRGADICLLGSPAGVKTLTFGRGTS